MQSPKIFSVAILLAALVLLCAGQPPASAQDVLTYHNNFSRTFPRAT